MTDGPGLTAHVLDLTRGIPAAGMAIRLSRFDGPSADGLVTTATDADGRTGGPLLSGAAFTPGRYELAFGVGDYFAAGTGVAAGDSAPAPYLDVVPVHFGVAEGVGHLHVALLVTPWSYTTYRGS